MRKIRLTREEKRIENELLHGEYIEVAKDEFQKMAKTISERRKDAVLNIRINSADLENLKRKAAKLGLKYQTFISELLHQIAHQ